MRTGITSDGEDGAVGAAAGPSQVIQFSRRAKPPHDLGSAASDDPLSSEVSIGSAAQAVVLRLANKRIRLRVEAHGSEEGGDRGPR